METKYQELSKESIQSIANEFFEDKIHLIEAQDKPKAIFIAGQSGAGKTQAANLVKAELKDNGGYVPVDADRMREKLPMGGIAYPSEQTQKDAGALVSVLRKRLIQERINFFEEGTFRDSESVKQGLVFLKSQGYQVEMVAVATSFEKSLLGIHDRYERQLSSGASNPRLVPADYHQKAFDGFTNTFQETAHLFDRVRVVNRMGQELYDSHRKDNTQTAYEALQSGRKMSVQDWQEVQKGWERVIESAKQRGNATEQYMADVTAHKNRVSAALRAEKFKPEGMTEKAQTAKANKQRIKHKNSLM